MSKEEDSVENQLVYDWFLIFLLSAYTDPGAGLPFDLIQYNSSYVSLCTSCFFFLPTIHALFVSWSYTSVANMNTCLLRQYFDYDLFIIFSPPILLRRGSDRTAWWATGSKSGSAYHSSKEGYSKEILGDYHQWFLPNGFKFKLFLLNKFQNMGVHCRLTAVIHECMYKLKNSWKNRKAVKK